MLAETFHCIKDDNVMALFSFPAQDVFAATFQYKVICDANGQIVGSERDNACCWRPELCSLLAGGK